MKSIFLLLMAFLMILPSCSHTSHTTGPITIVQLKSLDFNSIRPRLVTLLGKDSSGLEALSMITTYEDFLLDHYPIDTSYTRIPDEPSAVNAQLYHGIDLARLERDQITPNSKQIPSKNIFLQILHQNLLMWINELDNFHSDFIYKNNIRIAKKGAAAGYNALISGPSVNDIPRITGKMQQLIDSVCARNK